MLGRAEERAQREAELDWWPSQTCSSWGASKELELEKCKEDLQGSDMEKIFSISSRISKVMSGKAVWE